jgi:small conductance mechanosensitive channel
MPDLADALSDTIGIELGPYTGTILSILLILLFAYALVFASHRITRLLKRLAHSAVDDVERQRRIETLSRVVRHVSTIVISALAGMLVLSELGISIAPILGAAGIVGVAVGFGAQSLVRDFFNGVMILLENQIRQGDVVEIAGRSGVVESVTLRHVRLRGYEGNVHFVPTGMIDTVTNMTMEYSFALLDVGVAYREDLGEVFDAMRECCASMRSDPVFADRILDDLDLAGVERWDASSVTVRARVKTVPLQQWSVRREYLRRLKELFDARGIEIPFPHLTVYAGQPKAGNAPPFRLAIDRNRP